MMEGNGREVLQLVTFHGYQTDNSQILYHVLQKKKCKYWKVGVVVVLMLILVPQLPPVNRY